VTRELPKIPASLPIAEGVLGGNPRAVGKAISLLERGDGAGQQLLAALRAHTGRAYRVGVTGPAGVGKSSLLREVLRRLRRAGERVALVAADPVSPVSGGALLGDRCRLGELLEDPDVFVRSIAHRGAPGEPAPGASVAADVLDAAGFPWVFLETVGSGQMDVAACRGLDLRLLVLSQEYGDEFQMLKAGFTEVADLIAVNKCDQPGARAWVIRLTEALSPAAAAGDGGQQVFAVAAATGEGVDGLVAVLREKAGKHAGRGGVDWKRRTTA
jgi:LAO/AO transport system kinase